MIVMFGLKSVLGRQLGDGRVTHQRPCAIITTVIH